MTLLKEIFLDKNFRNAQIYAQQSFFVSVCSRKHPIFKALLLFQWLNGEKVKDEMITLLYLLRPNNDMLNDLEELLTEDRDRFIKDWLGHYREDWVNKTDSESDPKQKVLTFLNSGKENNLHTLEYISLSEQLSLSNLFNAFADQGGCII